MRCLVMLAWILVAVQAVPVKEHTEKIELVPEKYEEHAVDKMQPVEEHSVDEEQPVEEHSVDEEQPVEEHSVDEEQPASDSKEERHTENKTIKLNKNKTIKPNRDPEQSDSDTVGFIVVLKDETHTKPRADFNHHLRQLRYRLSDIIENLDSLIFEDMEEEYEDEKEIYEKEYEEMD
ncbi:uncharacterized protein LOC116412791 [Galleria mellonella]|uniref:Uncharacterized protein LOC116412791 n=1 Tax=Galleria mellonella TaxID=7137 RepID=A0A6J3BR90_GALME|nr:uncharacterized protein LOC116412791 [Galleria mellonella]